MPAILEFGKHERMKTLISQKIRNHEIVDLENKSESEQSAQDFMRPTNKTNLEGGHALNFEVFNHKRPLHKKDSSY